MSNCEKKDTESDLHEKCRTSSEWNFSFRIHFRSSCFQRNYASQAFSVVQFLVYWILEIEEKKTNENQQQNRKCCSINLRCSQLKWWGYCQFFFYLLIPPKWWWNYQLCLQTNIQKQNKCYFYWTSCVQNGGSIFSNDTE